jgi:hypothetical protein
MGTVIVGKLIILYLKRSIFWDITPYSRVKANRELGVSQARIHPEADKKQNLLPVTCLFLIGLLFKPEDGGEMCLRNVAQHLSDCTSDDKTLHNRCCENLKYFN